jgi:glycosyltransferase involved in cell wall biosynthesis
MKVILLSHKFPPDIGGLENVSEIFAEQFSKLGCSVKVVTWSKNSINNINFTYKVFANPTIFTLLKLHFWADIVFENNPCLRLSWPAYILRKKLIIVLHGWILGQNNKKRLVDHLKRFLFNSADKVVAISDAVKFEVYPKAITILNPFNSRYFAHLDYVDKNKDFVFVGRLVSDKGCDFAISAIHRLCLMGYKSTLTIIGNGPERIKLENQVLTLGLEKMISFKGSLVGRNLCQELLKYKFMLITSSWKEPFGIVALESIAAGVIPIVSDGGGLPEAVGSAGIVYKRGNLDDLIKNLILVIENPTQYETLINNGTQKILKHTPELVANQYFQLFKQIQQIN